MNINKIRQEKSISELINFGILNIDKPSNWTSFDVVNYIRKILNLPKCGHFGTLDPMVTGVLPICLGNACKIQEYFMHREKIYDGTMKLHKDISKEILEKEMKKFLGVINQLPPRISRVKRVIRKREIMEFKIIKFDAKKREVDFTAKVEAGTYIRKLIDDLGKNIGGAHMLALRRKQAGLFKESDKEFVSIEKLEKVVGEFNNGKEESLRELIIPAEIITQILPVVEVNEEALTKLKNGSPVFDEMIINLKEAKKIIDTKEAFAIVNKNKLVEIAKYSDKFEQKSILAKAEAVLI